MLLTVAGWVLAGCQQVERRCGEDIPIWVDGDAERIREIASAEPIAEVMAWIESFEGQHGEPLCVAEVVIEEGLLLQGEPVSGYFLSSRYSIHLDASATRDTLIHEACHAVDHDKGLSDSAPELFPPIRRKLPKRYGPNLYATERFARGCAEILPAVGEALTYRSDAEFMLTHVWKSVPFEIGPPATLQPVVDMDDYALTMGPRHMFTQGADATFTSWDWRAAERLIDFAPPVSLTTIFGVVADEHLVLYPLNSDVEPMWTVGPLDDAWKPVQPISGPSSLSWHDGWYALNIASNPPELYRLSETSPVRVEVAWDPGEAGTQLVWWRDSWWVQSHKGRQFDSEFGERVVLPPILGATVIGDRLIHALTRRGVFEWDVERKVLVLHPIHVEDGDELFAHFVSKTDLTGRLRQSGKDSLVRVRFYGD